jgi:hypothetical protein
VFAVDDYSGKGTIFIAFLEKLSIETSFISNSEGRLEKFIARV